ncbi:MAG: tRNA (adenosine(37)-N6)-threonylcarbamoyltransferase complex ATPase subunit type 1 TsaE [Rhodobacteraceae bacterium]|nr:tRNA (adenosine(37)-N6)-threonylcarbamoyltransferase complex ATPase subunit type 1 TsaE [Paracoccaceae bacterium]
MTEPRRSLQSLSPQQTARLAARLGARLAPGDCLLLDGPIGAGKTHFARALIRSRMTVPEEVPSPTFTLVQTYHTSDAAIWHADLYRLAAPDEIEELGLTEAFETAICLVEWPDRLGTLAPDGALTVGFATDPHREDMRRIGFEWTAGRWADILEGIADD